VPDSDDLSTDTGFETATTMSDAKGRFMFVGVPEGRYRLRAILAQVPVSGGGRGAAPPPLNQTAKPAAPPPPDLGGFTLWATQTITVGATDVTDLAVALRPGFRIAGRSEFVGTREQPAADVVRRMFATFDPADARPLLASTVLRGSFDDRGRLLSYQVPPGRYYVRINNNPPGWTLKSAMLNGRDISNVPVSLDADISSLIVTFTDRPSTVSGQVQSPTGAADPTATVLVFPAEAGAWTDTGEFPRRLRAIRVDRRGQYRTEGLPAGDYLVVAVVDESSTNWQDPRVLRALTRLATPITLGDGETRSVALKTSVVTVR